MVELRPYQLEAVERTWDFLIGRPNLSPVIVLPTGAGKSLVLARLSLDAVQKWDGRVVILAHRKELLEQNAEKVAALIPGEDVGIYSAGLRRRDTDHRVLIAGIQSIYGKAHAIGARHLVLVDEAHLVPADGEGMYRTFFQDLAKYNRFRTVGLTATPFRTDSGPLCHPEGLFQKICYSAPVAELIASGYLSPITNKATTVSYDTSALRPRGGEFIAHEVESLFMADDQKIEAACREIVARTTDRRSVLVFCAGVRHAEQVASRISLMTRDVCGLVTGETQELLRASTLAEFRSGRMKFCVNVNVLTTGFDAPGIDAIAILRTTASAGLFAQMVGRGFRTAPEKTDCLVLDFGENFQRHGPLDDPSFGAKSSGSSTPGEAPSKSCPNCKAELALSATECRDCGFVFVRELKHGTSPDEESSILSAPEVWQVISASVNRHEKKKDPDAPHTLRVNYLVRHDEGNMTENVSEWVCLNHEGFAKKKALAWWRQHTQAPFPSDDEDPIEAALELWDRNGFRTPTRITTVKENGFFRIQDRELPPFPELLGDAAEPAGVVDVVDEWATGLDDVPF